MIRLLAELINFNRQPLETTLENVRRIELDSASQAHSDFTPYNKLR